MSESSVYRDHGLGDTPRHSRHKRRRTRTRGEEDLDGVKRARPRYDDDERRTSRKYDEEPRKRSMSPRGGANGEAQRGSRRDEYRRRDEHPRSRTREERHSTPVVTAESRSHHRALERSPSASSARHHHSHHHRHHHHHHHHRHHRSSVHSAQIPVDLPFGARSLVRSDFEAFKPLFAQYLDVQKSKDIAALDEREARGRWKSFVGKWNRGELAEGWYCAETLADASKNRAVARAVDEEGAASATPRPPSARGQEELVGGGDLAHTEEEDSANDDDDDDNDDYGPLLPRGSSGDPSNTMPSPRHGHGPAIPSTQDLALRRENAEEERLDRIEQLRLARKADRAEQKARLEDLVPRAEAGTRERQLEKKREVNEKMRGFREKSPGAAAEVGEAELMGGGDGVAEYKQAKAVAQRRKTEREVRREEELRAKTAEREERLKEYRLREESTMKVLKQIARERFG